MICKYSNCSGLTSITSYIDNPFPIYYSVFGDDGYVYKKAFLYVPVYSFELYKTTAGWKNFKNIIPIGGISLALKVVDKQNNDVTNHASITWYDADKNQIGTGKDLNGVADSTTIYYSIVLDEEIGRTYREVTMQKIVAETDTVVCQLAEIGHVVLEGRVSATDIDKTAMTVNVKQLLNGKWEQDYATQTNEQGVFRVEVYDDQTDITISGDGYFDASLHRDGFDGNGNVGTIPMNLISGFAIAANITLQQAVANDQAEETADWTGGLNNIEFTLYNETKNTSITDFATQNENVIIKSGAEIGDEIRLTAKSKQGFFADATALFTIEAGANSFNLALTELGGIDITYASSSNGTTIGYLYDANNKLAARGSYAGETLSLRHIKSGTYTLVSMGSSTLLGNMPSMESLHDVGLQEGSDYVATSITVADGLLTATTISAVPSMDDTRFYYTSGNTYFNANKESLTAGNYLTLTAHLDFKPEYSEKADIVKLSIDIPEGCQIVENSAIANRQAVAHTIDGNRLTMTLNKDQWKGQVRFCIIPVLNQTYTITAMASFGMDGNVLQPIGTAQFEAKGLSLSTPEITAATNITIQGTAKGHSEVRIYDNDVLIGTTSSKADGSWTATCELYKPYDHSFHDIYAKIVADNGMELTSETKQVEYDKNLSVPQKVTMTYYNGWYKKNKTVEFNLLEGTTTPASYPFYSGTDFTFLAEFTRNDSTLIKNVNIKVLNSDGTVRTLPATFDGKQNKWVATTKYSNSSRLPQNVAVEYDVIANIEDVEHSDAIADMAAIMVNSAYQTQQVLEQDVTLTLKEENDNAASFDYLLKDKTYTYYIEEMDYSDAESLMSEKQFVYSEVDSTVIGSYTEMTDYSVSVVAVDVTNKYAFRIRLADDARSGSRHMNRRAPADFLDGFGTFAGLLGDVVGVTKYLSVRNDFNNMKALIEQYQNNYNQVRAKISEMILAKCPDGNYRLGPTRMQLLEIDKQDISSMEDKFTTSYYQFLDEYKRKLLACIATDFATMGVMAKINGAIKTSKFLGETSLVNQWFLKRLSKGTNAESSANLLQNIIGTIIGNVISSATDGVNNIFKYQDFIGTRDHVLSWASEENRKILTQYIQLRKTIENSYLKCDKEKEKDEEKNDEPRDEKTHGNKNDFNGKGSTPEIDPSGYVYEAVLSNRLEGVTATCYQKVQKEDMYGDITEEAEMWNAEDFSQQNPLKTDADGFYRWDVPQGMWQVKYEKEGYETAYSEWLPVPPPQLDVNIGMKQSTPPTVKQMRGYESGITIETSKYMRPATLNTTNVTVTRNGMDVKGSIDIENAEKEPRGDAVYASKIKFIPEMNFETTDEVIVTVHKEVESYCGVNMVSDFVQKVEIKPEIKEIVADSVISIPYQGSKTIQVVVLPKTAAMGKTLRIHSSSAMIAAANKEEITLDENGSATLTLNGELPGSAFLTFAIDNTDMQAQSKVKVVMENDMVATPIASITSGLSVDAGTQLTLTCETEGATIYYTLDGSCPCDEAKRIKYEAPIVIDSDVIVKAIAVKGDMDDSDIATFVYLINDTGIESMGIAGIRIWPLVTSSTIHIDLKDLKAENITVVNMNGATMYSAANVRGRITIDLGRYVDGMYIVNVKCKDGRMVRKIVKIRD